MARVCPRCSHHNEDHAKFCLSCGAMLDVETESEEDPLLGKVLLGRYRPISVLGEGGMGKVYLAEQKMGTATRKVAIKTLHPELSNDPQLVARFHRESETVIELRHPNTIQFYDFGELDDATLIIVMEYIEGKPLSKVLEISGAIGPERADKIIIQICGSLHEAHGRGIVHRDLKPENVLLTNQGGQTDFVKVLDFGIAKRDDAEDPNQAKLTKQGMVLGTPPYMSPEQFSGQKLDARSDVYSLGVMAYEMLVGRLPFEAATPWEWATKHLTAPPTPLEAYPAGTTLPENKKAAVLRALGKNRDHRQQNVQDFLREFTGHQDASAAWTSATSSGPGVAVTPNPAGAVPPTGVAAYGTPAPAPQTQPGHPGQFPSGHLAQGTPQPGYPSGSMQSAGHISAPGYGTQPVSHPGVAQSAPGYAGSYPGATGQQPMMAVPSGTGGGGALGKLVIAGIIGFFVFAGAAGGLAWYVSQDGDEGGDPPAVGNTGQTTTTDPNVGAMVPNNGTNTGQVGNGMMQPTNHGATPPPDPQNNGQAPTHGTQANEGANETPDAGRAASTKRPPRRTGPSPADQSRARALVAGGMGAARRNDFAGAVASLRQAQRLVGRRHPSTQELRNELSRRGGNQVGILLQQGRCPQAQALYRQLNSVGAGTQARRQFGDWCRPS